MQFKQGRGIAAPRKRAHVMFGLGLAMIVGVAHAADPVSVVSTVAGGGTNTSMDIPALSAGQLNLVDVAPAADGGYFLMDLNRVLRVDGAGILHLVTTEGDLGAGSFRAIASDPQGNLYIAGMHAQIWKRAPSGEITPFAGTGEYGEPVEGGQALTNAFGDINDIATDGLGNLYVLEYNRAHRIGVNGAVHAIAGTGLQASSTSGDGGPALQADIKAEGIAADRRGFVFLADEGGVRRISPDGQIDRVTGSVWEDDAVARNVSYNQVHSIDVDAAGNLVVGGQMDGKRIGRTGGLAPFFGWRGSPGYSGDGGPSIDAKFTWMRRLALDAEGNTLVVDQDGAVVRKLTPSNAPPLPASANAFSGVQHRDLGNETYAVAAGDVNGDGRTDALALTTSAFAGAPSPGYSVHVYLQAVNGTLPATPLSYAYPQPVGTRGGGLATADLNKDGKQDVIVGTHSGLQIRLGTASGLGAAVLVAPVAGQERAVYLQTMDLDRDGRLDIIARTFATDTSDQRGGITVFYGNGTGGVSRTRVLFAQAIVGSGFDIADFNRDGLPDIATLYPTVQNTRHSLQINLNNGADGFRAPVTGTVPDGVAPRYVVAGDFDGDGRQDIAGGGGLGLVLLRQDANGAFVYQYNLLGSFWGATGGDMDGDGDDDLLFVKSDSRFGYMAQNKGALSAVAHYAMPVLSGVQRQEQPGVHGHRRHRRRRLQGRAHRGPGLGLGRAPQRELLARAAGRDAEVGLAGSRRWREAACDCSRCHQRRASRGDAGLRLRCIANDHATHRIGLLSRRHHASGEGQADAAQRAAVACVALQGADAGLGAKRACDQRFW